MKYFAAISSKFCPFFYFNKSPKSIFFAKFLEISLFKKHCGVVSESLFECQDVGRFNLKPHDQKTLILFVFFLCFFSLLGCSGFFRSNRKPSSTGNWLVHWVSTSNLHSKQLIFYYFYLLLWKSREESRNRTLLHPPFFSALSIDLGVIII